VRTGEHDLAFKRQRAREFLKDGVKVKVEIVLRGREHTHRDLAREVINKFLNELKDEASFQFEQPVMGSPRGFNCVVSSRK
jgi:translation initiation factor IF-3